MNHKIYYIVYNSPVQVGAVYHRGEHPLASKFYKKFQENMARSLMLSCGKPIHADDIIITNVIEVPEGVEISGFKEETLAKT
jgi:hypothetical protein